MPPLHGESEEDKLYKLEKRKVILKIQKAKIILSPVLKEHPVLWISFLDTIKAMGYIDKNGTVDIKPQGILMRLKTHFPATVIPQH